MWRWLGLALTILIILLGSWNLWLTYQISWLVSELESPARYNLGDYPAWKIDQMYLHVQSIERLIRTAPLVECIPRGNKR
jgi:hypothetical protein